MSVITHITFVGDPEQRRREEAARQKEQRRVEQLQGISLADGYWEGDNVVSCEQLLGSPHGVIQINTTGIVLGPCSDDKLSDKAQRVLVHFSDFFADHYVNVLAASAIKPFAPRTEWQLVPDEASGHSYYWNPATNEVSWTAPANFIRPRTGPRRVDHNCTTLYHCTNYDAATAIVSSQQFLRGSSGTAGGAIYFARSAADARRKAQHGHDVCLAAEVFLGNTKLLKAFDSSLTFTKLQHQGYDSVWLRSTSLNGDEFVLYNYDQVENIRYHYQVPKGSSAHLN